MVRHAGAGNVRIDVEALVQDFIDKKLERSPAGSLPTKKTIVEDELVKFATDQRVQTTRARLVTALKTKMHFQDVGVTMPVRRTFYPYSYPTNEQKTLRMARL